MAQQSCPNCGEPRIGNFAFCRSCGLDYDAHEAGASGSTGMPPEPVAGITSLGPPLSTPAGEATVAPGLTERPTGESSRGRLARAAVVVAVILVVVASVGWAMRPSDTAVIPQASTSSPPDAATRSTAPDESATPSLSAAVLSATDAPPPSPIAVAIPATVALPKLSATVPGATKIRYFSVVGDSPIELIDQVVAKSKPLCKSDDTLACVVNAYTTRWIEATNLSTGSCKVSSVKVALKSTVNLPRWTGPSRVQPALITWWKTFSDHLAWHEGQHIKIQKTYDSKLKSLVVGHKCSSARSIIAKWERSLNKAQDAFDTKDMSWPYPEYTGPGGFYGVE